LVTGAEILDLLVGVEDIAPDLTPEPGVLHRTPLLRHLLLAPLLLELGEPRLEDAHRRRLVRRLGALVLALDDDARGDVGDPDGRVGFVRVLAAGAGRAVGIDA